MNNPTKAKILVLGVDGMDPGLTKKYLEAGKLPNLEKYCERGARRADLRMLGGVPTITPPMWTTLATGSYPNTHGITCFWRQDHESLDTMCYNLDSRLCQSEQLWNVFAEAGKKTLVWHWPGSSWPPTSLSPNLAVVDGMQPGAVSYGCALIDSEKLIYASDKIETMVYKPMAANDTGAGCIITDLPVADISMLENIGNITGGSKHVKNIILSEADGESGFEKIPYDIVNSPITAAQGWLDAPTEAKEFALLLSHGLVRRYALLSKDAQGNYTNVAIYKNKKAIKPIVTLTTKQDELVYVLEDFKDENSEYQVYVGYKILKIADDGSNAMLWVSPALDTQNDAVWHPKSLHKKVIEHAGYIPATGMNKGADADLTRRIAMASWEKYTLWQGKALEYLIKEEGYEVIFSHIHNIDAMGHGFWHYGKQRLHSDNDPLAFQQCFEDIYRDTDCYLGRFLPLLDEGWTIFITSDHGLLCSEEEEIPLLGDAFGCNFRILEALGFAHVKKDAAGHDLKEIDWAQTKALAARGNHIWINLKGRNATGIVEPEDKYALENEIISALYNYRQDGKRIISLALRNKDAEILGMSGPECGDIVYFIEEGFNRLHGDALSTTQGYCDTTVSPIFIAAGRGIKQGCQTERVIRQVDFAPTVAAVGGVRMPAQCEGAPVYQILES